MKRNLDHLDDSLARRLAAAAMTQGCVLHLHTESGAVTAGRVRKAVGPESWGLFDYKPRGKIDEYEYDGPAELAQSLVAHYGRGVVTAGVRRAIQRGCPVNLRALRRG